MKKNYQAIDIMRVVCSIMVIVVHTYPFYERFPLIGFFSSNIFGRILIPFFFICAGYFFQKGDLVNKKDKFKSYSSKLIRLYLLWSILYIPFGIFKLSYTFPIEPILWFPAAILSLGTFGTYFHLWYMAALIGAVFFCYYYLKKFSLNSLLILGAALFTFGCVETYYGALPTIVQGGIDVYMSIFFTTRNALFMGIFLFSIGLWIAKKDFNKTMPHPGVYAALFFTLFVVEALFVRSKGWAIDYNFYFLVVPFSFFWFCFLLNLDLNTKWDCLALRQYSVIIYFSHGIFLELVPLVLNLMSSNLYSIGAFRLFSVLIPTLVLSYWIKHHVPQLQ
ncbi:MAG: acyltransferase family protein [Anaerorhabdus sp.]